MKIFAKEQFMAELLYWLEFDFTGMAYKVATASVSH